MGLVALVSVTVSFLVLLTTLVLDFVGILRRGTAPRWMLAGLLIMNSAGLISMIAQVRGWSYARLDVLDPITFLMTLTGAALAVRGVIVLGKERRTARRAGHPAD